MIDKKYIQYGWVGVSGLKVVYHSSVFYDGNQIGNKKNPINLGKVMKQGFIYSTDSKVHYIT